MDQHLQLNGNRRQPRPYRCAFGATENAPLTRNFSITLWNNGLLMRSSGPAGSRTGRNLYKAPELYSLPTVSLQKGFRLHRACVKLRSSVSQLFQQPRTSRELRRPHLIAICPGTFPSRHQTPSQQQKLFLAEGLRDQLPMQAVRPGCSTS